MAAFNFQAQFAPKIESKQKTSTIRADRKDGREHCRPGESTALYTGMRTKACRLLARVKVVSVSRITIKEDGVTMHNGQGWRDDELSAHGLAVLAAQEGFANFNEMKGWFKRTHSLPFTGTLISWSYE